MRLFLSILIYACGLLFSTPVQGAGIPFEFRDGLIWIKVAAVGSEVPLNFLLDSGAGSTVLSTDAARKLQVRQGPATTVQRVNAAGTGAYRARDFQASWAGIPVSKTPLVVDLSHTSSFCCRPIDGLVGQDFLRGRIVQINFKTRAIYLLDRAETVKGSAVMKLKLDNSAFCVALSVNGSSPRWTRLDTGCDDSLHWVGGGEAQPRSSVRIGTEHLTNVKTAWHRTEIFPSEAGLLGNGVLSNYVVTIDAVKGRLLLKKA
ncbi:MAG: hypothetical protein JWO94_3218 [Verrucomicrobiaceae bacterium]|nr:hypothetical protein [Verrucomicrobiaceae bacterium]